MTALVAVGKNTFSSDETISVHIIKRDMEAAGYTEIAVSLALRGLSVKGLVESGTEQGYAES